MSLDPLTPQRHSLRDGAHRGVCLPIGVCLCMCVYLILLPVPSGAYVRACPAAAQCECLLTQRPLQIQLLQRSRVDCFNIHLIGRLSASENAKRGGESDRGRGTKEL